MLRFCKTKVSKEECAKYPMKIWDVNVGNIVISKLVETKSISKYLIEYLNEQICNDI